ncbi:uncharacterized protein LOC108150735 [Drosophila elegans]|uniref:uncharacterized protein LOC108150735 n=1 Tax=Drosophila elegans TaxID=30023 RepID=UPI0007E74448|nr:uncharacterized protein LOC108150735 [Drosophila elegans]
MNYLSVLAIIAIFIKKTTYASPSFPFGINNNYLGVRNLTLPRTTSHPHSYRPLLPAREFYKERSDNKEDDDDREFFHKRVARGHPASFNAPRLLGEDNHLYFTDADDRNDDYQSDQPGILMDIKGKQLGAQKDVDEHRERPFNRTYNAQLLRLAAEHLRLMAAEGACQVPKPEVVHISRETNTVYSPRATILHRCRDTYGCCAAGSTCQAKSNETVERVFIKQIGRFSWPEIKYMENHTECECVKVEMRRKRSPICQCPKHFIDFSRPGTYPEAEEDEDEDDQVMGLLERKERKGHRCRCDCHLSDDTCKRLKNGVEGFSVMERRLILGGAISAPFCNYGPYDVKKGRCPGLPNRNLNLQHFQTRRQHGKS